MGSELLKQSQQAQLAESLKLPSFFQKGFFSMKGFEHILFFQKASGLTKLTRKDFFAKFFCPRRKGCRAAGQLHQLSCGMAWMWYDVFVCVCMCWTMLECDECVG